MTRRAKASTGGERRTLKNVADAVRERLDATPERLARAREAGATPIRDADPRAETRGVRRILDPFDVMRANRVLAPHDPKLNDIRWLIGESLRRTHQRARLDALRAVAPDRGRCGRLRAAPRPAAGGGGPPRPRQAAQGGGAGRPCGLADPDPDHHRWRGGARMPRLRPRARHSLARRRGRDRSA
jgi:hypothetical protein